VDAGADKTRDLTDRWEGLAWCVLGLAILIGSLTMDRLEEQSVPPYAAPGLLPGLLGIAMILFGGTVAMRRKPIPVSAEEMAQRRFHLQPGRLALVLGMCLAYSFVLIGLRLPFWPLNLIGDSLPFWLASAIFVTVSVLVLQHPQRKEAGRRLDARALAFALVIGLGAGIASTLVFQDFFLVRLP
jgi:hypothetical protein